MTLSSLGRDLNIVRPLLEAVLLGVMTWRKFYRIFPIFFLYVGQAVLQSLLLKAMIHASFVTGPQYYYAYTSGVALAEALSFAVVYEIFTHTFVDYPALRGLGQTLLRWASVLLLLVAIGLAWLAPGNGQLMSSVYVVVWTISILQCGLLVFLLLFSRYFRVSWRSHTFGIALGFGIIASLNLATYAIRARIETAVRNPASNLFNLVTGGVYLCSILVWMAYLWAAEPVPHPVAKLLPSHDLESWNEELQRLLRQ